MLYEVITDCLESALDLVTIKAAEKGLELAYVLEPSLPQAIVGDITRLRQILANLLSNAVKFTEVGEVVVTVRPLTPDPPSPFPPFHFSVRDTGIGIPQDQLGQLFQAFSQRNNFV